MDRETQPWAEPLGESYWQALLSEEQPQNTISPADEETWEGFQTLAPGPASEGLSEPQPEAELQDIQVHQRCWEEMKRCFEQGEVLELEVVGFNRGGLLVACRNLQGFVPASQLVEFKHISEQDRLDQLHGFVGHRLQVKIIELDGERKRLILSQRAAQSGLGNPREILDRISPGQVCEGWVTNVCPFGAFVDLGGMEGLVHISELSWGRVNSPHDVLTAGDRVQVYVLSVDRERCRVSLSLKQLQPDPWNSVDRNYQVGQLVDGLVTNVVDFGAFVRIEEGLEGLVHASELAEGDFLHPRNVVREGESVTLRVINIDSANHRLGLSFRQV